MSAAPSDPKPTAADLEVETLAKMYAKVNAWFEEKPQRPIAVFMFDTMREEFFAICSERDEARGRAEAAERERDELANWIKRIHGQAEAAQAVIHGQKLTVDLEVEKHGEIIS